MDAALAEQRRGLVARAAADGHARERLEPLYARRDAAVLRRGRHRRGQHAHRHAQHAAQVLVPAQAVYVEEHGARAVGVVRDVLPPAGEVPDEPGVHGAEDELAALGTLARARHVFEYPAYLGAGKVGVDEQARLVPYVGADALGGQPVAEGRGPAALPDDGVVDGIARGAVPDEGGLALVGDADGGDVRGLDAALGKGVRERVYLCAEDVRRVVLHPAGPRVYLRVVVLRERDYLAAAVEHYGAGTCRALVEGDDVAFHLKPPC